MKRIIAVLTACLLGLSVTGCGSIIEKTGATLDISLELAYISEQLNYSSKKLYPEITTENGIFLSYSDHSKERKQHIVFWDAATEEFTEMELHDNDKDRGNGWIIPLADGRIGMLFQSTVYNRKDWDYEDADACIDVYNSDRTYAETIPFNLNTDGNFAYHFCSVTKNGADYFLYTYIPADKENVDNSSQTIIMILDGEMQYLGEINVPVSWAALFQGASGDVYAEMPLSTYTNTSTYSRVNLDTFQLEPIDLKIDQRFSGGDILDGTNGYEFFSYGKYGVCGVTINGTVGEAEEVMDFRNSNFLTGDWLTVAASPDGRFIIIEDNVRSQNMWLSRKRTEEEMKNVQVITMAGVGFNAQLEEVVNRFNRTHDEYHIMMMDYMQYVERDLKGEFVINYGNMLSSATEEEIAAGNLFMQDLMNGIVPDIICTDNLPYVQLANKGIFLDMTELMEKDERFREEDYVMSFFDSMKYKGQQQTIAFSFYINTITGKSELVGNKTGLSAEEYQNMLNSRPDGMRVFDGMFQETYRDLFLPWVQNSFLDTENVTCSFDSPAFVKMLEIGSTLPKEGDWDEYTVDETLLEINRFDQPINYRKVFVTTYQREPMTLVGYPVMDNGNGCIFSAPYTVGINAMSKYQDVVWDIFMELLGEDTQRFLDIKKETYSFPVLRSALDEDMIASTKGAERMSGTVLIGRNSEEDIAFLMDYIEHTTKFYYNDPAISDIISEEAQMYYAGDQTAEEAAKMIQSRVSIYISEQY